MVRSYRVAGFLAAASIPCGFLIMYLCLCLCFVWFYRALEKEKRDQIWEGRKGALWATMAYKAENQVWTTDVCVPISRLAVSAHNLLFGLDPI